MEREADEPLAILIASVLDHWARGGQVNRQRVGFTNRSLEGDLGMNFKIKQ